MPTALTVLVVTVAVPPLGTYCAVPEPGTGVLPSVVYQIPVLASRLEPEVVKVTVCDPVKLPLAGEIVGVTLVCAQVGELENVFPVAVGTYGWGFSFSLLK